MTRRYVVVGGGVAGHAAAEELRRIDPECGIALVGAERHPLYDRAALPGYLRGEVPRDRVLLRTPQSYRERGIDAHLETWVIEVDVRAGVVRTNRGSELPFDALLIATGARPKPPPWPGTAAVAGVYGLQTLDDADELIERSDAASRVLVLGGGFIAYELAAAVARRGRARVTWVMRRSWMLRSLLDEAGGRLGRELGEAAGVDMVFGEDVRRIAPAGSRLVAETAAGRRLGEFDALLYGVGLDYYTEPLNGTGAELRHGAVTDTRLGTAAPGVYAAGDVALGGHVRVRTWDRAEAQGVAAARNMAGDDVREVTQVPTYTTTLFGSVLTVLGITPRAHPGLASVQAGSSGDGTYRRLFLRDGRLVGAVMIGPPAGRDALLAIMRSGTVVEGPPEELLGLR